jgi:hypothetical protein
VARTHIVMSDAVISEIDRRVGARGRSRFIEEAAREKLDRLELEEALNDTRGIARGKRYNYWRDQTSTAAWVREGRRSSHQAS